MMVLAFGGIGLLALAGALGWVTTNGNLIYRNNQQYRTVAAAEAATEKILTRVTRDYKNSGEATVYANRSTYAALVPTSAENPVWANFVFNNAQGGSDQTYIERTATETYVPLESQYSGLSGFATSYRVVSNAREVNGLYTIPAAVQQDVQLASIPIFQFAIFYNTDIELNGSATLNVRGRVHGNANLFTGSSANQYFFEDVTTSGIISNGTRYGWATNGTVYYYDSKDANRSQLTLPIGTNNTAAAVREVLQPPPVGEDINSAMGQQRYYNKAELVIQVTETNVLLGVKEPNATSLTTIESLTGTNFMNGYFVTTTNRFTDQRESKLVLTTEIDVGKFITWATTNATVISTLGAGKLPNLIYVKDSRTINSSKMPGVRLVNARTLPTRGLSVATPNPLYTKGHFNQPSDAAGYLGGTNTSNTKPASLVSDAYTLLSSSFSDGASAGSYSSRVAVDTTVVAAIVSGNVLSGATYSGGANNLPRLLEAWSGRTYTLNGSLVCLFNSAIATAPFQNPGVYYSAPTRNINFDPNFLDANRLPPGTPAVRALVRGKWVVPPVNTVTYAGY